MDLGFRQAVSQPELSALELLPIRLDEVTRPSFGYPRAIRPLSFPVPAPTSTR
jgi:hypothetical protein